MVAVRLTLVAWCFLLGTFLAEPLQVHASPITVGRHAHHLTSVKSVATPYDAIVVLISASTNTCAVSVIVDIDGNTAMLRCGKTITSTLPVFTIAQFFDDVAAASPLNNLPLGKNCIKPVSFATTTRIMYGTQVSPDLSCSHDAVGQKLYHDVFAIISAI